MDEKTTKKKFLSLVEFKWLNYVLDHGDDWDSFVESFKNV